MNNSDHGTEWKQQANCKGQTQYFYPPPGEATVGARKQLRQAKAKAICNTCPVKDQCLAWAMENEPFGIWGGLTLDERIRRGGKHLPNTHTRKIIEGAA